MLAFEGTSEGVCSYFELATCRIPFKAHDKVSYAMASDESDLCTVLQLANVDRRARLAIRPSFNFFGYIYRPRDLQVELVEARATNNT